MAAREFSFKSASSPGVVYRTLVNDDGLLSCGCPGWITKRVGKPRHCKHTKQVAADLGLELVERDGQMFVAGAPSKTGTKHDAAAATVAADAPAAAKVAGARERGFVDPMLASKMPDGRTADDFGSDRYVMEEKYDGHRVIVTVSRADPADARGAVRAWSRLANARTLPDHIVERVGLLSDGTYDGELVVPGMKSYGVTAGQNSGKERLVLFDLLEVLGRDVKRETQDTRRALLEAAFGRIADMDGGAVVLSEQSAPSLRAVKVIWARGGEGAIIKTRAARYQPGYRTGDWVKVKAVNHVTVTITGFDEGKSGPYSTVVGIDAGGVEVRCKTLDNATLRDIAAGPGRFIGVRLVVEYQERTPDGKYRHPMFDHFAGEKE